MKTKAEPFVIAAMFLAVSCAAALHDIRTIVDIADDLCQNEYSKPDHAAELAGLSVAEFCAKPEVKRAFQEHAASAQHSARASLARPAP